MNSFVLYAGFFFLGAGLSALVFVFMFSKLKSLITSDFTHIANETIKNEQEDLRKQNREVLEEKLLPFSKDLTEFKDKVEKLNISGVENTTKILEQFLILERNNNSIAQEAKNLTEALTKNQNIKGAYGEDILDTILQNSGMTEGIHYIKQYSTTAESLKDENIHKIRPDIIINLPSGRHLIVDSKVTLTSYLDYISDNSKLNEFKSEVKKRIVDLANKNYQNADNINQPDFILMYMPIDSSVTLLYEDSEIINLAYKSNIIITGTASLLAVIRLVNQLFQEQKQNENVQKIAEAGTNLYETFVQLCNELIYIQQNLDNLRDQFTTAINRFQRSNKNKPSLFSQVEELKNFGINTTKEIPRDLIKEMSNIEKEVIKND